MLETAPVIEPKQPVAEQCQTERSSVLLVGNFLSGAGLSRGVCEELAIQLRGAGWKVLTTSDRPRRVARLIDMLRTIWSQRQHYDVAQVDVYSGPAFLWAELACGLLNRLGKPFVLTLHGGNLPRFAKRWPGRVRRLLQQAAEVTVPSKFLLEHMQPYRSELRLLPNPLAANAYPFRLRSELQPRLVWLRAFCGIYNPTMVPRLLAQLRPEVPDIRMLMIGPDKGDGSLQETERLAAELGVTDGLQIIRGVPKNEVPHYLERGDIFVNTTNIDNTPVSVMEAMACGLCVVTTDVGGIPFLVQHERQALLSPPDAVAEMAANVRRLIGDPQLAERLSRDGRRLVETWDWSVILPQWTGLFANLRIKGG